MDSLEQTKTVIEQMVLLMEEILHHLGWLKPYEYWDNHHPWWCRILPINSSLETILSFFLVIFQGELFVLKKVVSIIFF